MPVKKCLHILMLVMMTSSLAMVANAQVSTNDTVGKIAVFDFQRAVINTDAIKLRLKKVWR